MPQQIPPSRYPQVALLLIVCGLYIFWVGATKPPGLNGPPWVMYAIALVFIAGAGRLIEMSLGNPGRGDWFGFIFCAGMGAAFVSIPFDGHPEACHSGIGVGIAGINSLGLLGGSNLCQKVFGAAGFLFLFIALVIAWRWIVSRFGKKPSYY